MKKTLAIVLAVMMLMAMAVTVVAEPPEETGTSGSILAVHAYFEELGNMAPQTKGGTYTDMGCMGLGPVDYGDGEFGDAFIEFEFEVEQAGTYLITVRYAAKQGEGQIRCADMIVNGGDRIALPIQDTTSWDIWADAVVEVELKEGFNLIHLKNVENFDNSTYKAINVDYLAWELKIDEPEDTTPETTEDTTENEPTDDTPVDDGAEDDAPQTGFATVALVVAALASGAYIATKKR